MMQCYIRIYVLVLVFLYHLLLELKNTQKSRWLSGYDKSLGDITYVVSISWRS